MTRYHNENEQSWRKLNQDRPEVAKAIEESDHIETLLNSGYWDTVDSPRWSDNAIYRAPMQTEAEKFLEKWKGKKIHCGSMWAGHYYEVIRVMDHNRVRIVDHDGMNGHLILRALDTWQLWEPPKVKLDTRRVAGWWCTWGHKTNLMMINDVQAKGKSFVTPAGIHWSIEQIGQDESIVFSKDPMKPLDQWQTLEEICAEAGR